MEEGLALLPPEQVSEMEGFDEKKMREREEGTLVDWYQEGAEAKLPSDILRLGLGGVHAGPASIEEDQVDLRVELEGLGLAEGLNLEWRSYFVLHAKRPSPPLLFIHSPNLRRQLKGFELGSSQKAASSQRQARIPELR